MPSHEYFSASFLDAKGGVCDRLVWSDGYAERVTPPFRAIVLRALTLNAAAVVIGHNHPGGDPRPSEADYAMTRKLARALEPLGIQLADHVIVAAGGEYRFREAGLL